MLKNIIFDFGGILIHVDYHLTEQSFEDLIQKKFHFETLPDIEKKIFIDYEIGEINTETFIWNIQHYYGKALNPRDIIDAWNAMLIGIPAESITFLKEIKQKYKIYLMSNTNALHLEWVQRHIKDNHQGLLFDQLFCKTYYSHIMGLRKPSHEIFEIILKEHELEPTETLFIDDIPENLVPPSELGIHTYNHPRNASPALIWEYLENFRQEEKKG